MKTLQRVIIQLTDRRFTVIINKRLNNQTLYMRILRLIKRYRHYIRTRIHFTQRSHQNTKQYYLVHTTQEINLV
jgi:hypothetical protein